MLSKIKRFFRRSPSLPPNITAGNNTDVSKTTFFKPHQSSKISIGKDCLIEGILSVYTHKGTITVGNNVFIGGNSLIGCAESITIEDDVLISFDCMIQDNDNHHTLYELRKNDTRDWKNGQQHNWDITPQKPIFIRKGAWIGAKVILLKGVEIGEGAVVGAGSVVTKSVQPYTVVAGNPARIIKTLK